MDAIVAVYEDWGIGAEGTQPVALSADRRYFREKNPKCLGHCGTENPGRFSRGPPPAQPGEFSPHPGKSGNSRSPNCPQPGGSPCSCCRSESGFCHRRSLRIWGHAALLHPGLCHQGGGLSSLRCILPQSGPRPGLGLRRCRPSVLGGGNFLPFLCIHPVLTSVLTPNFLIFPFLWHAPSGQTGICGI